MILLNDSSASFLLFQWSFAPLWPVVMKEFQYWVEQSENSVQIWVVGYLGSILTRFTISTNVVVDVWLLLKAADMRRRVEEQASKKITPKKEVKRTNGSGSNMVGLLKRKKSFKENFSKNSCSKAIYDFLK